MMHGSNVVIIAELVAQEDNVEGSFVINDVVLTALDQSESVLHLKFYHGVILF